MIHPYGATTSEVAHASRDEYARKADERGERERVTPSDGVREQLWLNGRLPANVLGTRFQVTKLTIGPFYRMRCTDLVTGREQEFAPGQWGFLEAWMEEQTEGRS